MPGSLRRPDAAPIYGGDLDSQNNFFLGQLAGKLWLDALEGSVQGISINPNHSSCLLFLPFVEATGTYTELDVYKKH